MSRAVKIPVSFVEEYVTIDIRHPPDIYIVYKESHPLKSREGPILKTFLSFLLYANQYFCA